MLRTGIIFIMLMISSTLCLSQILNQPNINSNDRNNKQSDTIKKWVNWNILFKKGSSEPQRKEALNLIKRFISDYARSNPNLSLKFSDKTCGCDPLLINLQVDTSGGRSRQTAPASRTAKLAVSGDVLNLIEENKSITKPIVSNVLLSGEKVKLNKFKIIKQVLAIIDTGLDTSLFTPSISRLLWRPPAGTSALYNFLEGNPPNSFIDDDIAKHGTAVTAIALKQYEKYYPLIMVLKAFDKNRNGSIFSVSCAIEYAIKNHAHIINASWGYYGLKDNILEYYVNQTNDKIPFIAAAGNTEEEHRMPLCRGINPNSLLTNKRLFYPACFSATIPSVISVTGLDKNNAACYYQNYSNRYVTIGIRNEIKERNCCQYTVAFFRNLIEGTSYATPVVSGKIGVSMMNNGVGKQAHYYLTKISNTNSTLTYVKNGQFIVY